MALSTELTAGTWVTDPAHSEVSFVVRHSGFLKVRGEFKDFTASVTVDENGQNPVANAVIKSESIDTRQADRDGHLKSGDFFDAEQFPEITFVSTSITGEGHELNVTGDLTIKGTTKSISFPANFGGIVNDPFGATRAMVEASLEINRSDFNVAWNLPVTSGGVLISDKVTIDLNLGFLAPAAA
jgi:polyisoprenoid-binding protein YceI